MWLGAMWPAYSEVGRISPRHLIAMRLAVAAEEIIPSLVAILCLVAMPPTFLGDIAPGDWLLRNSYCPPSLQPSESNGWGCGGQEDLSPPRPGEIWSTAWLHVELCGCMNRCHCASALIPFKSLWKTKLFMKMLTLSPGLFSLLQLSWSMSIEIFVFPWFVLLSHLYCL